MTKIALVTGSGRGIGAATALLAAKRGYAVCINYISREERARAVADEIRAGGGRAMLWQADTADEAAVVAMFEAVDRELGRATRSSTTPASPAGPDGSIPTTPPRSGASSTSTSPG